jgi:hypothetical protein
MMLINEFHNAIWRHWQARDTPLMWRQARIDEQGCSFTSFGNLLTRGSAIASNLVLKQGG